MNDIKNSCQTTPSKGSRRIRDGKIEKETKHVAFPSEIDREGWLSFLLPNHRQCQDDDPFNESVFKSSERTSRTVSTIADETMDQASPSCPTVSTDDTPDVSFSSRDSSGNSTFDEDCLSEDGRKTIRFSSKALILDKEEYVQTKYRKVIIPKGFDDDDGSVDSVADIIGGGKSLEELLSENIWNDGDVFSAVVYNDDGSDASAVLSYDIDEQEERFTQKERNRFAMERFKKNMMWTGAAFVFTLLTRFITGCVRDPSAEDIKDDLKNATLEEGG